MLEKIKLALRIKNNATDDDIQDTIDAALFDLRVSGVVKLDEDDPLIIQAVKLYCKANYGLDNKDYEKYQKMKVGMEYNNLDFSNVKKFSHITGKVVKIIAILSAVIGILALIFIFTALINFWRNII